jgi:hypothetical protein
MNSRRSLLLVLLCLFGSACLFAQMQDVLPARTADASAESGPPGPGPEDALLSPTCYVNTYFGFKLDLPAEAKLKPIAVPASADRRIQVLELVGAAPEYGAISLSAYEYKNKNYADAKGILRRELDQELFVGVEELHGVSKVSIGGHTFYYFETRRGADQHMALATELNGYILVALLKANDPRMVKTLVAQFNQLEFFPPQEAARRAGPDAVAYDGPAISAHRLSELKANSPAEHMDPGKVDGDVYRNAQLGMLYEFPKGWSVQPQGAIEPAVIRYHEKITGEPLLGPRERAAVKACRRTLISLWRTKPDADGQVPYDEFGEVTVSAMPLSCFPNIHFPEDPRDATAIRRFVIGLSLTEPLQRDMTDARTYEAGGKSFVLTRGTIAYKEEGDSLSRRVSVAMAFTQHRGYLLIWLFAAPHDAELRELMAAKVRFETEPASREAVATKNGGGSATTDDSAPPVSSSAAAPPASTQAPGDTSQASAPPVAPVQAENAPAPASPPTAQTYARPTLLREGEDMQGQQMQGKPVPKKQPN